MGCNSEGDAPISDPYQRRRDPWVVIFWTPLSGEGNTVGSLRSGNGLERIESLPNNDTTSVPEVQNGMIVGSLLGDAHLQKTKGSTQRCRLRMCHSVAQRQCVDWKHSLLLNPFCANTRALQSDATSHRTSRPGEHQSCIMYADSPSPCHSTWYIEGEALESLKVAISNREELLTDPISLAAW